MVKVDFGQHFTKNLQTLNKSDINCENDPTLANPPAMITHILGNPGLIATKTWPESMMASTRAIRHNKKGGIQSTAGPGNQTLHWQSS